MGLAKHNEEILQKILDNFDSLKTDSDLGRLLVESKPSWNPRQGKFDNEPVDPNASKYDKDRISLNLIKNLYNTNLQKDKEIEKLQLAVLEEKRLKGLAEKKLERTRKSMQAAYRAEIAELRKQLSILRKR